MKIRSMNKIMSMCWGFNAAFIVLLFAMVPAPSTCLQVEKEMLDWWCRESGVGAGRNHGLCDKSNMPDAQDSTGEKHLLKAEIKEMEEKYCNTANAQHALNKPCYDRPDSVVEWFCIQDGENQRSDELCVAHASGQRGHYMPDAFERARKAFCILPEARPSRFCRRVGDQRMPKGKRPKEEDRNARTRAAGEAVGKIEQKMRERQKKDHRDVQAVLTWWCEEGGKTEAQKHQKAPFLSTEEDLCTAFPEFDGLKSQDKKDNDGPVKRTGEALDGHQQSAESVALRIWNQRTLEALKNSASEFHVMLEGWCADEKRSRLKSCRKWAHAHQKLKEEI